MGKYKKTIAFKQKANGDLDFTDRRLFRFMLIPFQFDSLFMFGKIKKDFTKVMGIGLVDKVVGGDKYDIVYMNFGSTTRAVVVWEYNARKQIATLSRGKYAMMYGFIRVLKNDAGKRRAVLYARALQGWYVPTAYDVKKKYKDFQFDKEDDNDSNFKEFLDDLQEIKDGE